MNYINITKADVLNGTGFRTVLWCSGCSLNCYNCHNPETHDPKSGKLWTEDSEKELFDALNHSYIKGITFSGGNPLEPYNIDMITNISKKIKNIYPKKTQWLYTGYLWEQIKDLEIMNYLDVVVDGPYVDKLRDITLKWRGSSNQRVINSQESIKTGKVVLWCD